MKETTFMGHKVRIDPDMEEGVIVMINEDYLVTIPLCFCGEPAVMRLCLRCFAEVLPFPPIDRFTPRVFHSIACCTTEKYELEYFCRTHGEAKRAGK